MVYEVVLVHVVEVGERTVSVERHDDGRTFPIPLTSMSAYSRDVVASHPTEVVALEVEPQALYDCGWRDLWKAVIRWEDRR